MVYCDSVEEEERLHLGASGETLSLHPVISALHPQCPPLLREIMQHRLAPHEGQSTLSVPQKRLN